MQNSSPRPVWHGSYYDTVIVWLILWWCFWSERDDTRLKSNSSFGLQTKLLKVSLHVTSALLESDSGSSLTIPFTGSWSGGGWDGVEDANFKISYISCVKTMSFENLPKCFGNLLSFNYGTGISDSMECNSTVLQTFHSSVLTAH